MSDEEETIAILEKERGGRNKIGESMLHELARSDDYQALKNSISQGANVNQRDNGGWTPISEAVSFGKLSNVRLLLMKGANVNVKSTECLTDENGDKTTSSGLTPLMEACINGNVNMIRLLLQYKADVVLRDDDDWTAIDHLKEFLLNSIDIDSDRREKLGELIFRMEEIIQKVGIKTRTREEFSDLLELKRLRKLKQLHSMSLSGHTHRTSCARSSTNSSLKTLSPLPNSLDDDDDLSTPARKRKAIKSISSGSESEHEDTRNLNEYKNVIFGLRRNHKERPSSSAKPASVPARRKDSLAKRMFLNIQ